MGKGSFTPAVCFAFVSICEAKRNKAKQRGKREDAMDKTIATFKKNKFQEIRIGIREFKGNDLVDIRTWTMTQGSNEMVPTAKGVSINISLFAELKKAIAQVEDVLKENRMI